MKKITYFDRLLSHPGVPMMGLMTAMLFLAGMGRGFPTGPIVGLVIALPLWAIVLWTARTQPVYGEGEDEEG